MQKITPYKIKKAFLYLKHFGPREFMNHLFERLEPEDVPYDGWFRSHSPSREELEKQRKSKIKEGPLFSLVVPAYCTRERFFREMIDSVISQTEEGLRCYEIIMINKRYVIPFSHRHGFI